MIIEKHKREKDDDVEYEIEYQINNNKKLKKDENIKSKIKKKYKTINEIKDEINDKFQNLSEEEKNDNNILLKLIGDFDINQNINLKVLSNNLNALKHGIEKLKPNDISEMANIFINNYKKYRYTISTEERQKILNEYMKLTNNNNISDINIIYECKNPRILLQNFLLNILKLFNKCKTIKNKFSISNFYDEFSSLIKNEGYQIGELFFTPSNFGNLNYKYSKLFEEFLKIYDNLFFDENNKLIEARIIKSLFENKTNILYIFYKTIENKDELLCEELYLKYLKVIYIILIMCEGKEDDKKISQSIKIINNCMINLINKEELKKYIQNNPKKLYIKKNGIEIEVNNIIINELKLNEILIYKEKDIILNFNLKLYNNDIFNDLAFNIQNEDWQYCNFEYIEKYNFFNVNEQLKFEFKNNIRTILESPCVKEIYLKIESRFEKDYLFEGPSSKNIYEEIYKHIIFFPFPIDTCFGYCDKNHYDIYINMCDIKTDSFRLFGELYGNTNDIVHEIFHITPLYYILNSENKDIKNANSRISSKTKSECVEKQKEFLKKIKSEDLRIKKEEDLDFGDLFEIELYGFCIRKLSLKNTCELFLKETWYNEKEIKNFKLNYIKRSIKELEDNNNDTYSKEKNKSKDKKKECGRKKSYDNQNQDINKNSNDISNNIDIDEYITKSNIINIFFNSFPIEQNKKYFKNRQILVRKRGAYENEKVGNIYVRPLRISRNKLLRYNEFDGRRFLKNEY